MSEFTLDDMLAWCEPDHAIKGYGPDEIRKAIANALRAAQEMRWLIDDIADSDSLVCCKDWDAATKGKYEKNIH